MEYIQHDYDSFTFIPSGDYLIVKALHTAECPGSLGQGAKLLADVSAASLNFAMAESSVHIYLDPDYAGEDEPRFRWGKNRQW